MKIENLNVIVSKLKTSSKYFDAFCWIFSISFIILFIYYCMR
jgi:hypothetical protein